MRSDNWYVAYVMVNCMGDAYLGSIEMLESRCMLYERGKMKRTCSLELHVASA